MTDTKSIEVATDRANAINVLKESLLAMFPQNRVRVGERNFIGDIRPTVLYTHYKTDEEAQSGIRENDPCFMYFVIWTETDGTYYIDYPSTHAGRVFDDKTVKFRKIKGKTQLEAAQKLIKWFEKHRSHILVTGNEYEAKRT